MRRLVLHLLVALFVCAACTQDPAVKKQRAYERGVEFLSKGKYNEAIIELKNALQIDPKFVPALHTLGRAYMAKSWFADALRELQRGSEAVPGNTELRADLGRVFLELEAWKDAQREGEAIAEREPANAYGQYLIGAALTG